ncbi:hypothetical protein KCU67_g12201, partial [Aureobasidium melanogenum]
ERERQEAEDAEAARLAFLAGTGEKVRRLVEDPEDEGTGTTSTSTIATTTSAPMGPPPVPTFTRKPKKKTDFSAKLGIKKKSLV